LLTSIELYLNSDLYANHHEFDHFMKSKEHNSFDEVTLFTSCLTNYGMSTWEHSRSRTVAIKAEAGASCERNVWSGLFSVFALANVFGRPVFLVYPKTPNVQSNSVRDFFHGIISPFVVGNVEKIPVYIMRSRLSDTCSKSESWYSPNHFM
jgi:hypothetical protein